ncbi:MAG: hypothetical protein ACI9S8_003317 [Chlamydiales bacterium]|jgi:hypothetical protein
MSKGKMAYWASTGLLCAFMTVAALMYFFSYEHVSEEFVRLGYPVYLVYPLAILKLCGVAALLSNYCNRLAEWAYAGFFIDFSLALTAHCMAADGEFAPALLALLLLLISGYFKDSRVDSEAS